MSDLASRECIPCRGDVPPLTTGEAEDLLGQLGNAWKLLDGKRIEKEYTFPDFLQALAFTNRAGAIAEEQGHHPDLHLGWGRVLVEIWTHKVDGLTESDFVLAAKLDTVEAADG